MTVEPVISHLVLLPVAIPFAAAAVGLLLLRHRPRAMALLALVAMGAGVWASAGLVLEVMTSGAPVVLHVGGWRAPFGINLVADHLGALMALMCQAVLFAGVLYALGCRDKCVRFPVFYPLLLTLASGLTGAMLTGDLFNFFVFAELVVISGTVLTACSDHRRGIEAAYKYFYIALIAAMALLLANGCLYAEYGTLNMADLAARIAEEPDAPLAGVALGLLLVSLGIKCAAVPFHFWQPDFHTTSPTAVSAMLSSVVVKLGVYGLIRVSMLLYPHADSLAPLLVGAGIAGVAVGGLGALGTHDLKRMLAYSTLAQIGFMLVAVGWRSGPAVAAALVFAFNHAFVKAAMLMLAGAVASRAPVKSSSYDVVAGVGRASPVAGALFLLGGMALAGLPPMNGFVSKLGVFRAGVEHSAWVVLAALAVGSLFTLVYVARSFQRVWWESPEAAERARPTGDHLAAPLLLILACLATGIAPQPLLTFAADTAAWLADPTAYIAASLGGSP